MFNPFASIGQFVAVQVKGVVNTSSPGFIPGQCESVTFHIPELSEEILLTEGFLSRCNARCSAEVAALVVKTK